MKQGEGPGGKYCPWHSHCRGCAGRENGPSSFPLEPLVAQQPHRLFSPPPLTSHLRPYSPLEMTVTFRTCQSKCFYSLPSHPSSSSVPHRHLLLPIERLFLPFALSEDGAVTEREFLSTARVPNSCPRTNSLAFICCAFLSPSSSFKKSYSMDFFPFLFT